MKKRLAGLLATCALCAASANAAEPVYKSVIPLNQPKIEWPAGQTNREALVYLRLVVSEKGELADITLEEDRGFYNEDFVVAAKALAKSYRFKPATRDGEPIEQAVILPVAFSLGSLVGSSTKWVIGISDDFRAEVGKLNELFKKGDYAGADLHAQWMLRETVLYGYEFSVLKATLAQIHAAAGHEYQAIRLAEEASQRLTSDAGKLVLHQPVPPNRASDYLLPESVVVNLLELRMRLAANNGMLKKALKAYYELAGLVEMKPDDRRVADAAQLTAWLEGKEPVPVKGVIQAGGGWSHELYRRSFTLERVSGGVEELSLSCDGKLGQSLRYAPAEVWTVPDGAEDCTVIVKGEAGITFSLVELPD